MKIQSSNNRIVFYADNMILEFYRYAGMEATQVTFSANQSGYIAKFSPLYENGEFSHAMPVTSSIETMFDTTNITVQIEKK